MIQKPGQTLRWFLKDHVRQEVDFSETDQNRGIPAPPIEKAPGPSDLIFSLPAPSDWGLDLSLSVSQAIESRRSRRKFSTEPLTLDELSFLLWATAGVRQRIGDVYLRNAPSAGCRHALETYLAVLNVSSLDQGIYRYLPTTHCLVKVSSPNHLARKLTEAALEQGFAGKSGVTFLWTALPYRMEWRYREASYKVIALDAGHVCQNLYLACEAIGAGTCAIAAYHQESADQLLGVDGDDEFVIYLAPVGKIIHSGG